MASILYYTFRIYYAAYCETCHFTLDQQCIARATASSKRCRVCHRDPVSAFIPIRAPKAEPEDHREFE